MEQYCSQGLIAVGACTSAYVLLKLAFKICRLLRIYLWNTSPKLSKYGKWSVVTGSTDGIGKEIAFQLASRGQDIVLIARNQEKLQNVSNEIRSKFGVTVKTLKIDFSEDESIYEEIESFLRSLDIGLLVNNVGMASPPKRFLNLPDLPNHTRNLIRINLISLIKMHEIVLPGMVKRKRGLILNISSTTALQPMFCVYGATKAFVDYFSEAVSYEYEDKGITIQTCLPALVRTKMTTDVPRTWTMVEPSHFARELMSRIGKERRGHGCLTHDIVGWILRQMPTSLFWSIWKHSVDREEKMAKNE